MKKKLSVLLAAIMVLSMLALTACGGNADNGSDKGSADSGDKKLPTIGIVQITAHPSLDTIRTSILKELTAEGFIDGETVTIDYQNAQNDSNNLKTICQKFSANNYDLIIAIATPSAQAALGETTSIPIIFSAVTDPVAAKLLTDPSNPGGNITGTSDYVSVEKIMTLAKQITPDLKTIGALYSSGEANSVAVVKQLKEYAAANGLTVVDKPFMNSTDIPQTVASFDGKVDAVFSPIDNSVASAMANVTEILNEAKIPFYVSADSMVADGGLATCGISYEVLGQETAKMAVSVLNGTKVGTIPVKTFDDASNYINLDTAKKLGITIPADVAAGAKDLSAN